MKTIRIAIATCLFNLGAIAQTPPPAPHHGPPPEAYAACAGKSKADACTVELPDGARVSGQCFEDPRQSLFCRPERVGGPEDACSGKRAGDSCSVTLPDGSARSGTCTAGSTGDAICVPAR
jgi:hypothetical protein